MLGLAGADTGVPDSGWTVCGALCGTYLSSANVPFSSGGPRDAVLPGPTLGLALPAIRLLTAHEVGKVIIKDQGQEWDGIGSPLEIVDI